MNKLLPDEFTRIRNLFQLLLAETIYSLMSAKENALQTTELNAEARKGIESKVLPFESLYMTMKYTKPCLSDKYLLGYVKNKVKRVKT